MSTALPGQKNKDRNSDKNIRIAVFLAERKGFEPLRRY